jgi:DGQHR domain-containing protein
MPRSVVNKWVSRANADVWQSKGWRPIRERGGLIFLTKRLNKWQKFEMRVREFLRGIVLEDTIDPDDFGFTKYGSYQLDACGGLAGHFVLVDCTSANDPGARSLRDKIKDFHNKQPDFNHDVTAKFGKKYGQIHYVICTQDIDIEDSDVVYAQARGIRILPSESLTEWMKLRAIAGPTLAFQFIEYIAGEKIQTSSGVAFRFPALRLPASAANDGRSLYAFTATPEQLLQLGFVYRLEYKDPRGYQRPLKISKLKGINRFLAEDERNGFPNSLLVAFEEAPGRTLSFVPVRENDAEPDGPLRQLGVLQVPPYFGIAEVIDGQHRLFGYYDFSKTGAYAMNLANRRRGDKLLVVAYPDPLQTARPKLFLDINSTQTKIPKRQIWAMMARSRPDTEMGFISNIVFELNKKGVLRDKIQIPGRTRGTRLLNIANLGQGIEDRRLVDNGQGLDWNLFEGVRGIGRYPLTPSPSVVLAFNELFAAAKESALADWTGNHGFLPSNNGANVLLRIFVEILKHYRHTNSRRRINRGMIRRLLSPALSQYIAKETASSLRRRTSTEAGREAVAAEIMAKIHRNHRGFAAQYLADRAGRH